MQNRYCALEARLPHQSPPLRQEPQISVLQSETGRSTLSRQVTPDSACVRLDVLLYDTLELGVILRDYFAM